MITNRFLTATALAAGLGLFAAAGACAQTPGSQAPSTQTPSTQSQSRQPSGQTGAMTSPKSMYQRQSGDFTADDLIGTHVMNAQNEDIGPIVDLIISPTGEVQAAIISVGDFAGGGEKLVAVPFDDVHMGPAGASGAPATSSTSGMSSSAAPPPALIVIMTKEQLQAAPPHTAR
jgi:sporulation protein YlmC with PRC-barrel domain